MLPGHIDAPAQHRRETRQLRLLACAAEWVGSLAAEARRGKHSQVRVITTSKRPSGSKVSFGTFGLSKNILRAVADAGFTEPRPIQAKAIPKALAGSDVLGLAQTGTGKTAAFALPIIERLTASRGQNPRALIIAPTRELAIQIHDEIGLLAKYTNIRATTVFGGVGARPQVRALQSRPDVIVACPGRLLDLMSSGDARLDGVEVLVLDEADHMLDMGFLPDIKRILARLPERRQNLLFSATMPKEIRSLADRVLHRPHVVELAHSAPAETIDHALYPVDQKRKTDLLQHLLSADDFRSAIVFLRTKHRARRLAQTLDRDGHRAIALQGNMSQSQRQRAMQGFRDGSFDVLVATDIAARGIDVAKVSHVINYDVPMTPEAYTHRIGRTGRAEESGKAYTFVTHDDSQQIRAIERLIKMEIPRVKLRDFGSGQSGGKDELNRRDRAPGKGRSNAGGRGRGGATKRGGGSTRAAGARPGRGGFNSKSSSQPGTGADTSMPTRRTTAESPAPSAAFGAGVDGSGSRQASGSRPASKLSKNGRKRQRMRSNDSSADSRPSSDGGRRRR